MFLAMLRAQCSCQARDITMLTLKIHLFSPYLLCASCVTAGLVVYPSPGYGSLSHGIGFDFNLCLPDPSWVSLPSAQ